MAYPLNWPFAKELGGLGVALFIRVNVMYDPDAKVYIATSPNLRGLVIEASSLDEVKKEIEYAVPVLLEHNLLCKKKDFEPLLKINANSRLHLAA